MVEPAGFQPEHFKAAMRAQWDQSADGWNAQSKNIRHWLMEATRTMIEAGGIRPGYFVLDVAAGAGDQTLDLAAAVGPEGRVVASDLSPAILRLAIENARSAGFSHVEGHVADGENLGLPEGSFDAAVCRLGLMLFPDPLQGLRQMLSAVRPGGRVATVVFGEPAANPCITILMRTALAHAGMPPRDPFSPGGLLSLGKPGLIDQLFEEAGFDAIRTTRLPAIFHLPATADYLTFIRTSAGPILQILAGLDESARQAAWDDIERKLDQFQTESGWQGPNELLVTSAMRPLQG